jgi:hypothetical protein
MAEENLDLARRAYDAFNSRRLDEFMALSHPEIVIESRIVAIEGGYNGRDGLRRWLSDFFDVLPDYGLEIEELRDLGNATLAHARARAHGASSSTPLLESVWHAVGWRDGMFDWWRACASEAEALDAIRRRQA